MTELEFLRFRSRSWKVHLFRLGAIGLLVLILRPSLSPADIYRCVNDQGIAQYSDEPCGDNAVAAFDEYKMSVDDAAGRDIIRPTSDRSRLDFIDSDIRAHAELIGKAILPHQKLNRVSKHTAGYFGRDEVLDWLYSLYFGPAEYDREWEIEIFYRGSTEKKTVWLRTIRILKDGAPFEPSTMLGFKALAKVKTGEWARPQKGNGGQNH